MSNMTLKNFLDSFVGDLSEPLMIWDNNMKTIVFQGDCGEAYEKVPKNFMGAQYKVSNITGYDYGLEIDLKLNIK